MRLDKFLKVSRIIKRRTVANDACDASRVTVNSRPAKASYDVKLGDIIEIGKAAKPEKKKLTRTERDKLIAELTAEMKEAARTLEFEKAAYLRDKINELRK